MVGVTKRGPNTPALITSFTQFVNEFGKGLSEPPASLRDRWSTDPHDGGQWWQFHLAVKGFFDNGGQRLFVKRIHRDDLSALSTNDFVHAIQALKDVDEVAVWPRACGQPGFMML
jgi:hypothetical protein